MTASIRHHTIAGTVLRGHGVASGRAVNSPYPLGSVSMQLPFFKALGLDLSDCWPGTINVSIAPHSWTLLKADYCFERLTWTDLHPPETFSFARVEVQWQHQAVQAWLYLPHPETKAAHHQQPSVMEIIAPHLAGLSYNDGVNLVFSQGAIATRVMPSAV